MDMTKFISMLQNERRLRALTGLDFATFMALLPAFTMAMERYLTRYTLDGYLRESDRAITYTNSPLPSTEDRLLFILTYLKQNPIQEAHGQMFAMSQSNVSKWVQLLLTILALALADQCVVPARTTSELAAQLQADVTPTDESNYQLPEGSVLGQDSGFQGFIAPGVTILQPKKKPPKGKLTDEEKADNRWISHIRVLVEHSIGGVKVYRIVHDTIRHWIPEIRDQVMEICCGLYNFRIRHQMTINNIDEP